MNADLIILCCFAVTPTASSGPNTIHGTDELCAAGGSGLRSGLGSGKGAGKGYEDLLPPPPVTRHGEC